MFLDEIIFTTKPTFSDKSYWLYKLFIEFCKENKCMHILYNAYFKEERRFDIAIENFTMLIGLTLFFEKKEDILRFMMHNECNAVFERLQLWRYFLLKNYAKIPKQVKMNLGSNIQLRIMQIMREFGDGGNEKVKNALEILKFRYN